MQGQSEKCGPIQRVFVLTKDRPYELSRCLSSFATHFREFGRKPHLVVCDDSIIPLNQIVNQTHLERIGVHYDLPITYVGQDRKDLLQRCLTTSLGSDLLADMLFGRRYRAANAPGSNRNVAAALGGRYAYLTVDDDAICVEPKEHSTGRAVSYVENGNFALQVEFLGLTSAPNSRGYQRLRECLLDAHEQLLGHHFVQATPKGKERVAVGLTGVAGDSGMPNPIALLCHDPLIRYRFDQICNSFQELPSTRRLIRSVANPTIARFGSVMTTTAVSYQGDLLLPPFLRTGTGEDTAFGSMLVRLIPEARIGYLPTALLHDPLQPRAYVLDAVSLRSNDLLGLLVLALKHELEAELSTPQRYLILGKRLGEFASNSSIAFAALLESLLRVRLYLLEEFYERLLDQDKEKPDSMSQRILRDWHRGLVAGLRGARPLQIDDHNISAQAVLTFQSEVRGVSELLCAWPVIANEIKAAGNSCLLE